MNNNILQKQYQIERFFIKSEINVLCKILNKYKTEINENIICKKIPKKYWVNIIEKYHYLLNIQEKYQDFDYDEKTIIFLIINTIPKLINVNKKYNKIQRILLFFNI